MPFYYSESFVDCWEIFLYFSQIVVVQGVLRDFDTQQHKKDEELHRELAKDMRKFEKKAGTRLDAEAGGKENYDKNERKRRMSSECHERERERGGGNIANARARTVIRTLFSEETDDPTGDGGRDTHTWQADFIDNQRRRFSTGGAGDDAAAAAAAAAAEVRTLKCLCYTYHDPDADIAHPFGVHYRATRGTQISSNWLGLIV